MKLGAFGETWAVGYLTRRGYRVVGRNVRYRVGEIDIVAYDGEDLVFVEVKSRRSVRYGAPEDAIDLRRYRRLERAVLQYLAEHELEPQSYRVDVVAIEVDSRGVVSRCELLQGVEPPAS